MVDDPSSYPDLFPTEKKQEQERQRLFRIIEDLVKWENTTNEEVLQRARDEIWVSWRRACAENADHPRAKELFDRDKLPAFHDPFAGGGSLPLEAQRLGLEAYASDLNPVAVLICKAMIEIPPKFAGRPPVNPAARADKSLITKTWRGAEGLAEDVRYYGQWMRDEAEKRIGHLYPKIAITAEMANDPQNPRPDLKPYVGRKLTVIAWLWARTVKSPNPAFAKVDVPLASTFMLSTKEGKEAYVEPVILPAPQSEAARQAGENDGYRFKVKVGKPKDAEGAKNGTKLSRANFACVMSGTPISGDYIKAEGKAGRMGARLMAIVAEGDRGRVYLAPTPEHEAAALKAKPTWRPEGDIATRMTGGNCTPYGLTRWGDLFTPRQLVALTTFSDLVSEVIERVQRDAAVANLPEDGRVLRDGGAGAAAYAEALATYLGIGLSRWTDLYNSLVTWNVTNQNIKNLFARQAIPMVWDYAESNPFGSGATPVSVYKAMANLSVSLPAGPHGEARQLDAATQSWTQDRVVSTDPPYYDNIGYADLSDFFYVWLRRSLRGIFPDLTATVAVPKAEELVATAYRHGDKERAEAFFLRGMTAAMRQLAWQAHPAFPLTIYYAFKQSESEGETGTTSTGWETFLDALISAGLAPSATWPIRTERPVGIKGSINVLSSSIILACGKRSSLAPSTTRRELAETLKRELPPALRLLQRGNIAPVDLAQAAIGPGMAVFTRYERVVDASGDPVSVRDALALINQTLDEVLVEQEGDFDADTRWALAWFGQLGFDEGAFGVAETLSKAKNTSVDGMMKDGLLVSKAGKVRLLRPSELSEEWPACRAKRERGAGRDPEADKRLTVWETVHQLIRALEAGGESAAAELVAKLGSSKAEVARELAYRLYTLCERKKRAAEALSYNGLVQSWPEILRLSQTARDIEVSEQGLFVPPEE